jgi:RHS repeat-associated protein
MSNDGLDLNSFFSGIPLVVDGYSLESDEPYCATCGDPVNIATGSLWHSEKDFDLAGQTKATNLLFKRTYVENPVFPPGDFGPRWIHTWETKLLAETVSPTTNLIWISPTGNASVFVRNTDNSFTNPPGFFGSLTEYSDHYDLKEKHGIHLIFARNSTTIPTGRLTSLTEPHGTSVNLSYENGALSSVSTGLAGSISFTRNSSGLVTQVTRQRDNLVYQYGYNSQGNLSSSSDFDGNTTQYAYTSLSGDPMPGGLLASVTDPLGRVFSNSFYSNGTVYQQSEPGNATRTYNNFYYYTTVQDVDGNSTTYHFNSNFLLTQTDYPDGAVEYTTWTPQNQVASLTDPLGYRTFFGYDSDGNMTSIQKPLDPSPVQITYDPNFDQPTSITPLVGAPTFTTVNPSNGDILDVYRRTGATTLVEQMGYDTFGNPVSFNNGTGSYLNQTDSNGLLTFVYDIRNPETRAYDNRGRVISRKFKAGRVLTYTWDNHDRVTRVNDSTGPSTLFTYDIVNRLLSKTLTDGKTNQVTQYQWDPRNRLLAQTDPLGNKTSFQYDIIANGRVDVIDQPSSKTDADGNITFYAFDVRDRVIKKTDTNGGITQYQYNLRGDRTAVIDPINQTTNFVFDGNRRLVTETRPSLTTSSNGKTSASTETLNYFYDLSGKLIRIEKPSLLGGKSVISFNFDPFDRLIEKTQQRLDKNGNVTLTEDDSTFSYSPEIDKVLMTQANNGVENLSFSYDPAPPFAPVAYSTQATDPKNALGLIQGQYSVEYDGTNQVQSIKDALGHDAFVSSHDEAGRLLQIASGNLIGNDANPLSIAMKYDSFGRKSSISASDHTSGSMQYDLKNRISEIDWQTGFLFLSDKITEQLAYDPAGNVLSQTREFGKLSYGYDPTNELTSVAAQGSAQGWFGKFENQAVASDLSQKYGYDLAGNRTLASITGTSQFIDNQIVSNSRTTFQSDADGFGNLSSEIGGSSSHMTRNYTYRTDGKLTQMNVVFDSEWRCDPSINQVVTQTQYFFDALGRRVAKQTTFKPNLGRSMGPSLGFTQAFSYLVNQDKILFSKSGDGILSLYLDGQGIDEHLGKVSRIGTQSFMTDHLGSVLNSPISGALQSYDSYGRTIAGLPIFPIVLALDPVIYGFSGRQFDIESGKYYNRARMYDPNTGRFLNQDPLGLRGGSNLYRYVGNNPLGYVDPLGLCPWTPLLGIAGGVGLALALGNPVSLSVILLGAAGGFLAEDIGGSTEAIYDAANSYIIATALGLTGGQASAVGAGVGLGTAFDNGTLNLDDLFGIANAGEYNPTNTTYSLGDFNYGSQGGGQSNTYNLGDYSFGGGDGGGDDGGGD